MKKIVLLLGFFSCLASLVFADDTKIPSNTALPKIEFSSGVFDFGVQDQGSDIQHDFEYKNVGGSDLMVTRLASSCGCTAATASTSSVRPGQTGLIHVTYDSRGKFGHTHKEVQVFSNAQNSPSTIVMEGVIQVPSGHPPMQPGQVLFAGDCARCHAAPGQGKKGKELYDAVCQLCHDEPQEKGHWVAPSRGSMAGLPKSKLKKIISRGLKNHSMAGFSKKHGGPLDDEQVDSLVEYLISLQNSPH